MVLTDLESLPLYVLMKIAESLDFGEITNLCRTGKSLRNKLYENEEFWEQQFQHDFGNKEFHLVAKKYPKSWKEVYQNKFCGRVWAFGWIRFRR